jgi:hypothetical protein
MLRTIQEKIVRYGRMIVIAGLLNASCGTSLLYRTADTQKQGAGAEIAEDRPETTFEMQRRISDRGGRLGDICNEPQKSEWSSGYTETDEYHIGTACVEIHIQAGMHREIAELHARALLSSCVGNTHRQGVKEKEQGPDGYTETTRQSEHSYDTQRFTRTRYKIVSGMQCAKALMPKAYR